MMTSKTRRTLRVCYWWNGYSLHHQICDWMELDEDEHRFEILIQRLLIETGGKA